MAKKKDYTQISTQSERESKLVVVKKCEKRVPKVHLLLNNLDEQPKLLRKGNGNPCMAA